MENTIKEIRKACISNINSWENENFYEDNESKFITLSDFIASFENSKQTFFNVKTTHSIFDTPLQIERNILNVALWTVDDDVPEHGSLEDLVKLSSCTHYTDKYKPRDKKNIIAFTERQNGQWYFQPDQRCEVVQMVIDEDSRIGSKVLPYSEWLTKQK